MDVQSIPLVAGGRTELNIPGRFFMLVEAAAPVTVTRHRNLSPSGEVGRQVEAGYVALPGDWTDPNDGRFDGVILQSDTNQTIRIGISQNAADYRRTVGIVQVQQANDGDTLDDQAVTGASAEIVATNSSRKALHVQNTGANNIRVRLGSNDATDTRGVQLGPGQSVTFTSTAAVQAIREGGVDSTVSVTEETRT